MMMEGWPAYLDAIEGRTKDLTGMSDDKLIEELCGDEPGESALREIAALRVEEK